MPFSDNPDAGMKPEDFSTELPIVRFYKSVMVEIMSRIDAVEALVNQETGIKGRFAREAAHLHLRMICELIAVSCLAAHDGLSSIDARSLEKDYAADKIVNNLEKLHSRFYPQPIKWEKDESGQVNPADDDRDHLTKDDLVKLYHLCGGVLHRGSLKMLRKGEVIDRDWIQNVMGWGQKIVGLLELHALVTKEDDLVIFLRLRDAKAWIGKAL